MIFNKPIELARFRKAQKQNFGLTETSFNQLLQALHKGNEDLMVHIYEYHINSSVSYLMREFRVSKDFAYDICMDTLIELRAKFLSDKVKYGNLKFLFTRMAQNNLVDWHKRQKKLDDCIREFLDLEDDSTDTDQYLALLHQSIQLLDAEEEKLITALYLEDRNMKDLAEEYHISYSNLRKRKERVLKKLKKHFFRKYNTIR